VHRLASAGDAASLCDAVTALALPPPSYGLVPSSWGSTYATYSPPSVPAEIEIALWADAAVSLTGATLYGGMMRALAFADITVTGVPAVKAALDLATKTLRCDTVIEAAVAGEAGNLTTIAFAAGASQNAGALDETAFPAIVFNYKTGVTTVANFEAAIAASVNLDVKTPGTGANVLAAPGDTFAASNLAAGDDSELHGVAHGLLTGDGPVDVTTTLTFPTGLAGSTGYFVVKDDADNVGLAASLTDALTGKVIEFTGAGTGTIKITASADTKRVHWHSMGLLGLAGDGAIAMTNQQSYWDVRRHSPDTIAYAVVATFASGAGKVSGQIRPRVDG
jgi:hypothetical protein